MARILVIDDSALMRNYSKGFLEEAGHHVETFFPASAMEVIEKVKSFKPNLVLSDYNMPHVDGQTVARTVRRVDAAIPVIILTANHDAAKESVLGTMGVRRILHKPLQGPDLVQAVREVLGAI
jgi:CheY-like chemotaxis protein